MSNKTSLRHDVHCHNSVQAKLKLIAQFVVGKSVSIEVSQCQIGTLSLNSGIKPCFHSAFSQFGNSSKKNRNST